MSQGSHSERFRQARQPPQPRRQLCAAPRRPVLTASARRFSLPASLFREADCPLIECGYNSALHLGAGLLFGSGRKRNFPPPALILPPLYLRLRLFPLRLSLSLPLLFFTFLGCQQQICWSGPFQRRLIIFVLFLLAALYLRSI